MFINILKSVFKAILKILKIINSNNNQRSAVCRKAGSIHLKQICTLNFYFYYAWNYVATSNAFNLENIESFNVMFTKRLYLAA